MSSRDPAIRAKLLQSCPNKCFICGYDRKDSDGNSLLDGAHIDDNAKNEANDHIRNMILLCPNHHREYDRGIIDFDKDGVIEDVLVKEGQMVEYGQKLFVIGD